MILPFTVGKRPRKRHPECPDLLLYWENHYRTMPVQSQLGPLITNYLETTYRVMTQARSSCTRLLAVRLDLRFPAEMPVGPLHADNGVISRFLYFLRSELDDAGLKYPHDLRYVWCREQHKSDKPHYHLLLLFNGDAYFSIGDMRPSSDGGYHNQNLFHRIVRAWCRAMGWPSDAMQGLVHVARDTLTGGLYAQHFHSNDHATFAEVFYRASYLCKAHSKPVGQGVHCFDGSRR
ncbi:inovirus Gp2 family protein [Halomonas campisalis]|uniref:Inovirus Gp2 family protein n=1 Tax=Billgrantia campisalis TaxID=74661 RepID=A0ABS9P9T4_9GAMM|nr:inovirus-type Gp2 protein [Halomonas campisalis]MCG6658531.1 inovirus Gp2 family protein [Halomonas campisalis]MDR5863392.1 inovirus-type Gp2 protein [Halomonas campisalis]